MGESIKDRAKRYAKAHIDACERWTHGGIERTWQDEYENVCIEYWDGFWWHYKEENGEVVYW